MLLHLVLALGNSATATKLENEKEITLSGAVSGKANFDGSKNINIVTTQSNIAVLDGKMTLSAKESSDDINYEKQTSLEIDFPSNFNKDNCVCIAFGLKFDDNSKNYNYGISGSAANRTVTASFFRNVILNSSKISLNVWNPGPEKIVFYKVVLMKIS